MQRDLHVRCQFEASGWSVDINDRRHCMKYERWKEAGKGAIVVSTYLARPYVPSGVSKTAVAAYL